MKGHVPGFPEPGAEALPAPQERQTCSLGPVKGQTAAAATARAPPECASDLVPHQATCVNKRHQSLTSSPRPSRIQWGAPYIGPAAVADSDTHTQDGWEGEEGSVLTRGSHAAPASEARTQLQACTPTPEAGKSLPGGKFYHGASTLRGLHPRFLTGCAGSPSALGISDSTSPQVPFGDEAGTGHPLSKLPLGRGRMRHPLGSNTVTSCRAPADPCPGLG